MARERQEGGFKQRTFLSINKNGFLQATSKEEREGYEAYTNKNGDIAYKKEFIGSEFGHITDLGLKEKSMLPGNPTYVVIQIENETAIDVIEFPLFNMDGKSLSDMTRKFIAVLPNIDFSRELTISANKKQNERGYIDRVLFFNYVENNEVGDSIKFALVFKEGGDVPPYEKIVNTNIKGETTITYDYTNQDKYLYSILQREVERFRNSRVVVPAAQDKAVEVEQPSATPIEKAVPVKEAKRVEPAVVEDEDGDLPF